MSKCHRCNKEERKCYCQPENWNHIGSSWIVPPEVYSTPTPSNPPAPAPETTCPVDISPSMPTCD